MLPPRLAGIFPGRGSNFNSSGQLSPLERLLEHEVRHDYLSSEEHNEVDPTEWRKLLNNVKDLRVNVGLVNEFSHLVVYNRSIEGSEGSSYLSCRSLQVSAAAILVTRSPHSSKLAGTHTGRPVILTHR